MPRVVLRHDIPNEKKKEKKKTSFGLFSSESRFLLYIEQWKGVPGGALIKIGGEDVWSH